MQRVIVIRFGELFLKGKNRDYFESMLVRNIKGALSGVEHRFERSQGRYFVEDFAEEDCTEILARLQRVFGIHSLSVADKVAVRAEEDFPEIRASLAKAAAAAAEGAEGKIPFRVTVKRADKRIPMTSAEIAAALGGTVLATGRFRVDLTDYDCDFKVDIRENGCALVYTDVLPGAGGLPVGCSGRGMLMLSGGIDSPVAAYMMAKRGMKIFAVHFASPPYTSEKAREKVVELRNIVSAHTGKIKLFVVPFTDIQLAIHKHCPANFMITIMRRIMVMIAERVAKESGCGAMITGESLGQVASQTLESLTVTEDAVESLPVFRPLIGLDKYEIMDTAAQIGTYKLSELPFQDCCTVFLPRNPVIKPSVATARKEQALIEDLPELVDKAIENIEKIEIGRY